jgi:hypothetical protein
MKYARATELEDSNRHVGSMVLVGVLVECRNPGTRPETKNSASRAKRAPQRHCRSRKLERDSPSSPHVLQVLFCCCCRWDRSKRVVKLRWGLYWLISMLFSLGKLIRKAILQFSILSSFWAFVFEGEHLFGGGRMWWGQGTWYDIGRSDVRNMLT